MTRPVTHFFQEDFTECLNNTIISMSETIIEEKPPLTEVHTSNDVLLLGGASKLPRNHIFSVGGLLEKSCCYQMSNTFFYLGGAGEKYITSFKNLVVSKDWTSALFSQAHFFSETYSKMAVCNKSSNDVSHIAYLSISV